MLTYQDLLKVGDDESKRKDFVRAAIQDHQRSDDYKIAKDAYDYYRHKNVTIVNFQKLLYTVEGNVMPDNWSANFKVACRHFYRFIVQEVGHLLGNGISWTKEETAKKLGTESKPIDRQTKNALTAARWGKVSFGFYDKDHVEVFDYLEFVPLYDEYDGALKAGIRFWQIDKMKPLRATLYEIDGYTKYVWTLADEAVQDEPKQAYKKTIATSIIDGEEIYDERNYPTFPIVPMWANEEHQSALVGLREEIDCYDLIKSGFANTVDEASLVYWTITNAGGMDDVDLQEFINRIKTIHAHAFADDNQKAESHQIDAPWESREHLLDRLENDMYRDAMALDIMRIAGGVATATEIRAAYEDLNLKCDDIEYQVADWLEGIMAIAGVDDEPSFTRSMVINQEEMINVVLASAQYLSADYVTNKILDILGDGDKAEQVIKDMQANEMGRFNGDEEEPEDIEE